MGGIMFNKTIRLQNVVLGHEQLFLSQRVITNFSSAVFEYVPHVVHVRSGAYAQRHDDLEIGISGTTKTHRRYTLLTSCDDPFHVEYTPRNMWCRWFRCVQLIWSMCSNVKQIMYLNTYLCYVNCEVCTHFRGE